MAKRFSPEVPPSVEEGPLSEGPIVDLAGAGGRGIESWLTDMEVEELREYLLASAPRGTTPDDLVYLRGTFELEVESEDKPGIREREREVTQSYVFSIRELIGDDPEVGDSFRKALGSLFTNNMSQNWKRKTPTKRMLEEIELSSMLEFPVNETEVFDQRVEDVYWNEAMAEIMASPSPTLIVTRRYFHAPDNRTYVDVYDENEYFITSLPWYSKNVRTLQGLQYDVVHDYDIITEEPEIPPVTVEEVEEATRVRERPKTQSATGEKLYDSRVTQVELGDRYKARGRYYVKAKDLQGRYYTLKWYPRLREDLRGFGLDLSE